MSTEDNRRLVRRFVEEVLNQGHLDRLSEFMAEDIYGRNQFPGLPQGLEGQRQALGMLSQAFPDQHNSAEEVLAEGNKVVMRSTLRDTNQGAFMGIAATGRSVTVEGIDMVRIEQGKMVEHGGLFDALGMMQQLGMVPPPGRGGGG